MDLPSPSQLTQLLPTVATAVPVIYERRCGPVVYAVVYSANGGPVDHFSHYER